MGQSLSNSCECCASREGHGDALQNGEDSLKSPEVLEWEAALKAHHKLVDDVESEAHAGTYNSKLAEEVETEWKAEARASLRDKVDEELSCRSCDDARSDRSQAEDKANDAASDMSPGFTNVWTTKEEKYLSSLTYKVDVAEFQALHLQESGPSSSSFQRSTHENFKEDKFVRSAPATCKFEPMVEQEGRLFSCHSAPLLSKENHDSDEEILLSPKDSDDEIASSPKGSNRTRSPKDSDDEVAESDNPALSEAPTEEKALPQSQPNTRMESARAAISNAIESKGALRVRRMQKALRDGQIAGLVKSELRVCERAIAAALVEDAEIAEEKAAEEESLMRKELEEKEQAALTTGRKRALSDIFFGDPDFEALVEASELARVQLEAAEERCHLARSRLEVAQVQLRSLG